MRLVRMKAAPVKTDGERLGNEFMNGFFFFSAQILKVARSQVPVVQSCRAQGFPVVPSCRV